MHTSACFWVYSFVWNWIFHLRLKRSQSTAFNLDENLPEGEFKRGGVRATAGPRLGWSCDFQRANKSVCLQPSRWVPEGVCFNVSSFPVRWMLHLHAGPRIRCVTGYRSRVSVCMSTWLVCGSPPVRLFYRPHKQTWKGCDEVERFIQRTLGKFWF